MPRLVIATAVLAVILAPPLAVPALSGPIPTKLEVSGDESTLNFQITSWALDEILASLGWQPTGFTYVGE